MTCPVTEDTRPHSPLQLAELHEDLIALVLHLPVDAQDLGSLQQRLQGLPVVLHTRARAVQKRKHSVTGHWGPGAGEGCREGQV